MGPIGKFNLFRCLRTFFRGNVSCGICTITRAGRVGAGSNVRLITSSIVTGLVKRRSSFSTLIFTYKSTIPMFTRGTSGSCGMSLVLILGTFTKGKGVLVNRYTTNLLFSFTKVARKGELTIRPLTGPTMDGKVTASRGSIISNGFCATRDRGFI